MRARVLRAALALAEDRGTYAAVVRTSAVQSVLDLVAAARADEPGAPTDPAAEGTLLQQGMMLLHHLARHDRALLALFSEHPAVEDLGLDQRWPLPHA